MNKKDIIAPVAYISISVVFAIVCLAVYFSKGKSAYWIKKKFKLGGLLLTFTSVTSCVHVGTCYDSGEDYVDPQNNLSFNSESHFYKNEFIFDSIQTKKIAGGILNTSSTKYSTSITDTTGDVIYKVNLQSYDGIFDEYAESFYFSIDTNLTVGKYFLNFHLTDTENQSNNTIFKNYNLKITK